MAHDEPVRWEYKQLTISGEGGAADLARAGQDGWEAVGIAVHGQNHVALLKRPLAPGRNAG